jgi:uncharacterized protein involved in exopolysaccharide biosynthesis
MSSASRPSELDSERDVDLARWGRALVAQWWIVALGLVAGIVLGALFSLSGGSVYEATARIAPGQAFNPTGSAPVLTYLTNPTAINAIATSATTLEQAAKEAGMSLGQLRGHVRTEAVSDTRASAATRNAVLVDITVQLPKKKRAEDAANAIAGIVQRTTTSRYVRQSIGIYGSRIRSFDERLKTLQERIELLTAALREPDRTLVERMLLSIQLDQAQATQGQTIDSRANAVQQLILAQDVQRTQLIQQATGEKTTARSRRTSIIVGGLIGLIGGAIAAIIVDSRVRRAQPAS